MGVFIVKRCTVTLYHFLERQQKLLLDAVASSKFITERKSERLIAKLLTLINAYNTARLRRHLHPAGRVKSDNEKGYYIVDAINEAIDNKHKISFFYTDYNGSKQRFSYIVSPYSLIWNGDYYYVIGHCDSHNKIQTFRLDRIDR